MKVVFRQRAEDDINRLYDYIASQANAEIAFELVWQLRKTCLSLAEFPLRGALRTEVIPGLRIIAVKTSVIAYRVETEQVSILGVFHGGQNWTSALLTDE